MSEAGFGLERELRLLAGVTAASAVLHLTAAALASTRGEAGIPVAIATIVSLLLMERVLHGAGFVSALKNLGLAAPNAGSITRTLIVCAALTLTAFIPGKLLGTSFELLPGWPLLILGLFAQGGIAEECVFRAYLFGHLRRTRTFWRAAFIACIPFAIIHLLLFASLPLPVAAASLGLSIMLTFPLAQLYELGGRTIWAPALLHGFIQGVPKLIIAPPDSPFVTIWFVASATLPWLAFMFRRPDAGCGT